MNATTLSPELLQKMNAYWRAANYLSVGQIYLYDNPMLREPLKLEHVKPLVVGHWGTTPGQNFIYVHLNLESPGFRQNSGSGGQTEGLHFVGVLSFDDEFREDVAWGGIQEKFRQALAQGIGHDQLRGWDAGPNGAQPGAERVPDELREGDGQILKQSLAYDTRLDEDVVGVELAFDGVA